MNLRIEPLESRIAPAGLVDVAYDAVTGELTLTGDALENRVIISQIAPNVHRIEGFSTDIEMAGTTFLDIGKLTRLTIEAGDGDNSFQLRRLLTLTALSYTGGADSDLLFPTDLKVKGPFEFHGGDGFGDLFFFGDQTEIGGDLTLDSAGGAGLSLRLGLSAERTVIGGSLRVIGGGFDNTIDASAGEKLTIGKGIDFNAGPGGGSLELSAVESLTIGKLPTGESILFTGESGNDSLKFSGGNVTLAGAIRMTGGALDDTITFDNAVGAVKIGKLATGESIFFDAGNGNDTLTTLASNLTLAGAISLLGGPGANTLTLDGPGGTAKIGKLPTGQSIFYEGATGNDTLSTNTANLTLAGGIDFLADAGTNLLDLGGIGGRVTIGKTIAGQSILFTGGAGEDILDSVTDRLTLAGGIDFSCAGGPNLITFVRPTGSVSIGKLAGGQSILFNGGSDNDTVETDLAALTLAGGFEFNSGGGTNTVSFFNNGFVKIGKFAAGQSLVINGIGDAASVVDAAGQVTFAGSVEVTGGTGDDSIELDGNIRVGKNADGVSTRLVGGLGRDSIEFRGNRVALDGSVSLDGGDDADRFLAEQDLFALSVKGSIEMLGGDGGDDFFIETFSSVTRVSIGGAVTFDGGADGDRFHVIASGVIAGNVTVDLGVAGGGLGVPQSVVLGGQDFPSALVLKGALTVDGDAAASVNDSLAISNLSVAKRIDIELGGGLTFVDIDNLVAGDEFRLDTRGSTDEINFDRGNFFGGSVIRKLAIILTGDGDDRLFIGGPLPAVVAPFPDHTRVRFLGGLTADGGAGAGDNRNDITVENDFGIAPTFTNFELATLV